MKPQRTWKPNIRSTASGSLDELQRRIRKHLKPYFSGRRLGTITTADVRSYIAKRQEDTILVQKARRLKKRAGWIDVPEVRRPVSNGEINRELTTLKRIFNLAIQNGKLLHKPHIPMLKERNTRTGFFEPDQFRAMLNHLQRQHFARNPPASDVGEPRHRLQRRRQRRPGRAQRPS